MQSKAKTVREYLDSLPPDRRSAIAAVRAVILKNLDKGYKEVMQSGMIGYCVPHSIYPAGYHCDPRQPLPFAGLASQKQYMSLYLMGNYCGCVDDSEWPNENARWFQQQWAKAGKKLDMGKCCIRFRKLEDVALEVIGEAIRRVPVKTYIEYYESALGSAGRPVGEKTQRKKPSAKKPAPRPATKKPSRKASTGKPRRASP